MKHLIFLLIFTSLHASKPDFLILGAQKGGTTSLFSYLKDHPMIEMPQDKEPRFFSTRYFDGFKSYKKNFPKKNKDRLPITGEASANYLYWKEAPIRAFKHIPKAKLIVLLRNPIDRAFSRYKKYFSKGHYTRSFDGLVKEECAYISNGEKGEKPESDMIQAGLYERQLSNWLKKYPKEQLLILLSEDFFSNTQQEMDKIYTFLGLPPHIHESFPISNTSDKTIKMDPKTREFLIEFYRPYNDQLQTLFDKLGLDLQINWNNS